jgi:hypothetical protein
MSLFSIYGIIDEENHSTSFFLLQNCSRVPPKKQERYLLNKDRGHISAYGWVMIFMLLSLGVINFADRAVLGLAAVPIIRELQLSPAQYGLASGSFFLLYALSSVSVTWWSDRIGAKKSWCCLQRVGPLSSSPLRSFSLFLPCS